MVLESWTFSRTKFSLSLKLLPCRTFFKFYHLFLVRKPKTNSGVIGC